MFPFPYLFPFLFVGMFVLVIYILSRKGWYDLAMEFQYPEPFEGQRIGINSATINGVNYNNILLLRFNEQGLYMKPVFVFRLFHKPVLIPWNEFKSVRNKKILFFQVTELAVGNPAIAIIQMKKSIVDQLIYLNEAELNNGRDMYKI